MFSLILLAVPAERTSRGKKGKEQGVSQALRNNLGLSRIMACRSWMINSLRGMQGGRNITETRKWKN